MIPSFCSDHSPIFMPYKKSQVISSVEYFWKFINSRIEDEKYLSEMKNYMNIIKISFDTIFESNPHSRREFLKYEKC